MKKFLHLLPETRLDLTAGIYTTFVLAVQRIVLEIVKSYSWIIWCDKNLKRKQEKPCIFIWKLSETLNHIPSSELFEDCHDGLWEQWLHRKHLMRTGSVLSNTNTFTKGWKNAKYQVALSLSFASDLLKAGASFPNQSQSEVKWNHLVIPADVWH